MSECLPETTGRKVAAAARAYEDGLDRIEQRRATCLSISRCLARSLALLPVVVVCFVFRFAAPSPGGTDPCRETATLPPRPISLGK
ncbi:hypothetical protein Mp_Vg00070 [Marchantia polymorpha subsp. ruderalis]|uniref:Uncharacterized protein n=1 Tax=Marchantia polymorpha TaxID=3197 RepID=A0A2R6VWX6_MARPO|nr:hypothetical protein MARPO_YB0046 [Marchantia polymorpha]BBN20448.1 hypothetical protein Mp_Vg00070 [Marchantia polymorpha subsp. ruderalis]|eukprot:PTQ26105.1 hypothetical protein MARPO_YB0046 [Marchantia polymorpha]